MKISVEVKKGDKVTIYTADLARAGGAVSSAVDKVEAMLKDTFKAEHYTRDQ